MPYQDATRDRPNLAPTGNKDNDETCPLLHQCNLVTTLKEGGSGCEAEVENWGLDSGWRMESVNTSQESGTTHEQRL